jgi:dimeric dUTPase (all-alpha-NTP-PPase superfamily)
MNIRKMIETIELKEIDTDLLISKMNNSLIDLYNNRSIEKYTEILNDMLVLAMHLKYDLILKYLAWAPTVTANERIQFQEIFKCLGTRNNNKDWFLNLFSLFLGVSHVFNFEISEVERCFFEKKKS